MKALVAATCVLLVLIAVWGVGEIHKRTCVDAGRVSCSIAPWDDGEKSDQDKLIEKYGISGWG